jgi:hypothetical protein
MPPTNPEVIVQVEPTTGLPEDQDELPMSTIRTTRSEREVRTPQRLQDFVLLSNLSKQTYFTPPRNLPRVQCEVLNHQRLSTLRWDNLLTSLRSGSFGSLVSFVQQNSEDGYLEEWHPPLLATNPTLQTTQHLDREFHMHGYGRKIFTSTPYQQAFFFSRSSSERQATSVAAEFLRYHSQF